MVREALHGAHRLDDWLQRRLGRRYHAIIGVALVIEIGDRLREMRDLGSSAGGLLRVGFGLILLAVLLINQLGELHVHAARRQPPR